MSIQLDGHLTYPCERDDNVGAPGAAQAQDAEFDRSITWEGSWRYSKKQSRGVNESCGFKYRFVRPPAAGGDALVPKADGSRLEDATGGRSGDVIAPGGPRERSSTNDTSSGRNVGGTRTSDTQGNELGGGVVQQIGLLPTDSRAATSPPGRIEKMNDATPSSLEGGGSSAADGSGNASLGSDAAAVKDAPVPHSMTLYGPGGDGRLPSGTWSGYFIVKYSRNVEVKVQETFTLEFGSNSPRKASPSPTPTNAAGPVLHAAAPPARVSLPPSTGEVPSTSGAPVQHLPQQVAVDAAVSTVKAPLAQKVTAGPAPAGSVASNGLPLTASTTAVPAIPAATISSSVSPITGVVTAAPPIMAAATVTAGTTPTAFASAAAIEATPAASASTEVTQAPVVATATAPPTMNKLVAGTAHRAVTPCVPVPIAPVVRVSGEGQNKYGVFRLQGGHERATGRLDLTRFYFERVKDRSGGRSPSSDKAGTPRRKRGVVTSTTMLEPPGPSLAERRTKRTRHPNQRLLDDEGIPHTSQLEGTSGAAGGSGSGGVGSGSGSAGSGGGGVGGAAGSSGTQSATKRKATTDSPAVGTSAAPEAGAPAVSTTGAAGPVSKARRPRDRERDLAMEQARRAKRKAEEVKRQSASTSDHDASARARATMTTAQKHAEELGRKLGDVQAALGALQAVEESDPLIPAQRAIESLETDVAKLQAKWEAAAAVAAAEATAAAGAQTAHSDEPAPSESGGSSWGNATSGGGRRSSGRSKRGASAETWEPMTYDPETDEYYEGGWFRGRRHGKGVCVYAEAERRHLYEGEWRAGREHGLGKIMTEDRAVLYEGELADGKLCGKAVYTDESGTVYDGEWKDGAMHGRGVYTFPACSTDADGSAVAGTMVYDGEFRDNARCGRGMQTWPGGSYDGEWLDDARHGRGVLRTDDGFLYDGQWVDDLPEGRGMCIHPDGQRYEGVFRGGKKEGRGTLAFANGASYEGRFRDDVIDGQGMLHIPKPVEDNMGGVMIPIQFQSDIERIHVKAGFDKVGM